MRSIYYDGIKRIEIQDIEGSEEKKVFVYQDENEHKYFLLEWKLYTEFIDKESFDKVEKEIKDKVKEIVEKEKISKEEAQKKVAKLKDWDEELKRDRYEYKVIVWENNLLDIIEKLLD